MAKYETEGRQQLLAVGKNSGEIARKFGGGADKKARMNQSTVHRWLAGESRPDTASAAMLEVLFAIPASAWLTQEELERRDGLVVGSHESGETAAVASTGSDGKL